MKIKFLLLISLGIFQTSQAQKSEIVFQVNFKSENIGTLHAIAEQKGPTYIKDIKSLTDTKVIMMSLHVESEVTIAHENGIMIKGTAYRHANRGAEDVHAMVTKIDDQTYQVERNGKKEKMENINIVFCVADLFFKEPKGIKNVFSNMYTKMLTVKELGQSKYLLVTPDNKNSYYTYQNGKLMMVETDTPLGKVISKRI